jgi:hypothetical protein
MEWGAGGIEEWDLSVRFRERERDDGCLGEW